MSAHGEVTVDQLGPLARGRYEDLEARRQEIALLLKRFLEMDNGRYAPGYLPALRDLYTIEMQIDGLRFWS